MADELLRYVEAQIKNGYSPGVIRNNLVRQGYSPALVDGVIESVQSKVRDNSIIEPKKSSKNNKGILAIALISVTALGIIAACILFLPNIFPKDTLLDVKVEHDRSAFTQGDDLSFTTSVYNMGSAAKVDVTMTYKVIDDKDNVILSNEETFAVSTSVTHDQKIKLPGNIKPGNYNLKAFANYDGKIATSAFSFTVEKSSAPTPVTPSCVDGIKNQDEEGIDCGGACGGYWYDNSCHTVPQNSVANNSPAEPSCTDNIMNQDEEGIDCGGACGGYWYDNSCHTTPQEANPPINANPETYSEIVVQVRTVAKDDPESAAGLCSKVIADQGKDSCYSIVAEESNTSSYCELAQGYEERDSCYYPFFMSGDYSVCPKLRLAENKENCENLRDISIQMAQIAQENETTIS